MSLKKGERVQSKRRSGDQKKKSEKTPRRKGAGTAPNPRTTGKKGQAKKSEKPPNAKGNPGKKKQTETLPGGIRNE